MQATLMVPGLLLVLALPAGAGADTVYRCDNEGVVTFSDRPCGPQPTRHDSTGHISFIAPDENLPELARAAQALVAQRRRAIAERRRADSSRSRMPPAAAAPAQPVERTVLVPWPVSKRNRSYPHRAPPELSPALSERIERNRRYAPLGGVGPPVDRPSRRGHGERGERRRQ